MELGRALRQRREALGYTLEDVRAATKIRVRYLEALEAERYDELPAAVYTRGFIRSYATFLELDGASLAAAYQPEPDPESEVEPPPGAGAPAVGASAAGVAAREGPRAPEPPPRVRGLAVRRGTSTYRGRRLTVLALWIVALVAIVAAAYALQGGRRPPVTAARGATATAVPAATPAGKGNGSGAPAAQPAAAVPQPAVTTTTGTDSAGNALTTYRVTGASTLTVVARASARCWVRVWLDGSAAYTDRTLTPGQSATWQAQHQVSLRIGYPSGLHLTVDGLALPALTTVNPIDAAIVLAAAAP